MALWTPADIDLALSLWLDASDAGTITGSAPITGWADKSSKGNDAVISAGAVGPTESAGQLNGLAVADFSAATALMESPADLNIQDVVCFVVGTENSDGANTQYFSGHRTSGVSTDRAYFREDGLVIGSTDTLSDTSVIGEYDVYSFYSSSGSQEFFLNGDSLATGADATAQTYTTTYLGGGDLGGGNVYGDVKIAEMIYVPASLLSAEGRQRIEGYLAHKWGLEAKLDAAHPYKATAPTNNPPANPWTPESFREKYLWVDAADSSTVTVNGSDQITLLKNKAANGYDLTPEGAGWLTYDAPRSAIVGNGTGDGGLETGNVFTAANGFFADNTYNSYAIYAVCKPTKAGAGITPATSGTSYFDNDTNNNTLVKINGNSSTTSSPAVPIVSSEGGNVNATETRNGYAPNLTNIASPGQVMQLITGERGLDGSLQYSVNGTAGSSITGSVLEITFEGISIGSQYTANSQWQGDIHEIIVIREWDPDLSELIEGYLAHKWGLDALLPVSHPYKDATPTVNYTDEYANFVSLLLPFNYDYDDKSYKNNTVTAAAAASIDTVETKFGDGALKLTGANNSYVTLAAAEYLNLQKEDFTFEFWYRPNIIDSVEDRIFSTGGGIAGYSGTDSHIQLLMQTNANTGTISLQFNNGTATPVDANSTIALSATTWHHLALVGEGTELRLYIDGVLDVTMDTSTWRICTANPSARLGSIPGESTGSFFSPGSFDDVRATSGIARYTENFAIPTEPYTVILDESVDPFFNDVSLLLPFDSDFTDQSFYSNDSTAGGNAQVSSAQSKFGGSSLLLDGTGDSAVISDIALGELGDVNYPFTVEAWIRPDATNYAETFQYIFSAQNNTVGSESGYALQLNNSGSGAKLRVIGRDNTVIVLAATVGTALIPQDEWTHVALTRDSAGVWRGFVNGILDFSATETANVNVTSTIFHVGAAESGAGGTTLEFSGSIDDVRFTRNIARYTSDFVPPTEAFTIVTPPIPTTDPYYEFVSLLVPFEAPRGSTSFTDESPLANTITTFGSAQISSTQVKFGTSSLLLDGVDSYIRADAALDGVTTTTSPFTIEAWVYPNTTATDKSLFGINRINNGENTLVVLSDGVSVNNGAVVPHTLFPSGQWNHIAVTYSNGSLTLWLNGAEHSRISVASFVVPLSDCTFAIGTEFDSGNGGTPGQYYDCYVDDVRVTNGIVRYTERFTPPTEALGTVRDDSVDPFFNDVSLLIPFDGADTSTTFIDESFFGRTITVNADTQISTTNPKFGTGSGRFDGTGDFLEVDSSGAIDFSTQDFTIEMWVKFSAHGAADSLLGKWTDNVVDDREWLIRYNEPNTRWEFVYSTDGNLDVSLTWTNNANTDIWYHVAFVRAGTSMEFFLDGTSLGSQAFPATLYSGPAPILVGTQNAGTGAAPVAVNSLNGWIDDLRITNRVTRYQNNFTAPTQAFPIVIQEEVLDPYRDFVAAHFRFNELEGATTFTDSSVYNNTYTTTGDTVIRADQSKWNGRSVYFDGTTDDIRVSNQPELAIGSGDFTFEAWVYWEGVTNGDTSATIATSEVGGGTTSYWQLFVRDNGAIGLQTRVGTQSFFESSAGLFFTNQWHHVAAVRNSGICYVYIDGVLVTTPASDGNRNIADTSLTIGAFDYTTFSNHFQGYMDDVRFTVGIARYDRDFDLPTGPYATTRDDSVDPFFDDVSLLLPFEGTDTSTTIVDESLSDYTVTVSGNAQIDTAQAQFGSSLLLDGTGDYLTLGTVSSFNYLHNDLEDFTIDVWVRPNTLDAASSDVILDTGGTTTGLVGISLLIDAEEKVRFLTSNGTVGGAYELDLISTTILTTGQWYLISVTRSSGTYRLFVDGTLQDTGTPAATTAANAANVLNIGRYQNGNSLLWDGWIDDLRITRGTARYPVSFDVPTQEFPVPPIPVDPYYDFVTILLPFDGTDGSTTFTDESSLNNTVTAVGNAQLDAFQSKFGSASLLLDGVGDYATVPNSTSLFDAAGTWTLEMWVRPTLSQTGTLFSTRDEGNASRGFWLTVETDGALGITGINTVAATAFTDAGTAGDLIADVWQHVSLVSDGSNITGYVDGVEAWSLAITGTLAQGDPSASIGRMERSAGNLFYDGYIDDVRITKGVARYTGNFTPPAEAFGALRDDTVDPFINSNFSIVKFEDGDGSTTVADDISGTWLVSGATSEVTTAQAKFGTGSFLAGGTNAALRLTNPPSLTGDFTIEFWAAPVQAHQAGARLFQMDNGDFFNGLNFNLATTSENSNVLLYSSSGGSWNLVNGVVVLASPVSDQFYHFALTRVGSTVYCFVDGVLAHTWTLSGTILSGSEWVFGGQSVGTSRNAGYAFDEIRVNDSVSRYQQTFTPPTQSYVLPSGGVYTLDVSTGSFSLTGLSVDLTVDGGITAYTLDVTTASFNITGSDTTLARTHELATTPVAFTTTGGSSTANRGFIINSDPVAPEFNFTGSSIFIDYDQNQFPVDVSEEYFSMFGELVDLAVVRQLYGTSESFAVTGNPVNMVLNYTIDAQPATFNLTGDQVTIDKTESKVLNVTSGSFALTGTPVLLEDILGGLSGSFGIVGSNVTLAASRFLTQPTNTAVVEGATATITATAEGVGSLSYQWYNAVGDVALAGEITSTLSIDTVLADNGNTYYLEVTDTIGTFRSNTITLTVNAVPVITVQPTNQTVTEDGPVTFSVTATGTGTLNYQWYREGVILPGATSSSLVTTADGNKDGYEYYVTVTDDNATITSSTVILDVNLLPVISIQPTNKTVFENNSVNFTVFATGENTLNYQWYNAVGDVALAGETGSTLSISPVPLTDNGNTYYVVLTDSVTGVTTTSNTVTLTVNQQTLAIVTQPVSTLVPEAALEASFSVVAVGSGVGQPTYQWYDAETDQAIPGETGSTLTLTAPLTDRASYYVIVADSVNVAGIQSNIVYLDLIIVGLYSFVLPEEFGNSTITVDRAVTMNSAPTVYNTQFGDGYAQRAPTGLSNIDETYTITIKHRPPELIDRIATYFESLSNVEAFEFTIANQFVAGSKEVIQVLCTEFSVVHNQVNSKSLQATLKRVYEKVPE